MQQHVVPIGGGDVGKFVDSVFHNHVFYNSYKLPIQFFPMINLEIYKIHSRGRIIC